MRPSFTVLLFCLLATLAWSAAPPARNSAVRAKAAARKAPQKKRVAYRKPVARKPSAPATPASTRIRAVQQALIERGYLNGEPNGVWGPPSVEAMKKLETDQNVKVDGKIDSKMLIALGLGPQYDSNLSLPTPADLGLSVADAQRDE